VLEYQELIALNASTGSPHLCSLQGYQGRSPWLVSVAIRPTTHVIGDNPFSGSDFDLLRQWIELNFETILQYWNEEIDTGDLVDALRPLVKF
jgi:hypothetical protein